MIHPPYFHLHLQLKIQPLYFYLHLQLKIHNPTIQNHQHKKFKTFPKFYNQIEERIKNNPKKLTTK